MATAPTMSLVGEGASSNVFECEVEIDGKQCTVAKKILNDFDVFFRERAMYRYTEKMRCRGLGLESIVKCFDSNEDEMSLTLQYCRGPDLLDHILDPEYRSHYNEHKIYHDVMDIGKILSKLQELHIVHTDIKAENLVYLDSFEPNSIGLPRLMLIDFGGATRLGPEFAPVYHNQHGTLKYKAPELFNHDPVSHASDAWSFGVLSYRLLYGDFPFHTAYDIRHSDLTFDESRTDISDDAKDFLRRLLEKDPQKRMTISEALSHPWKNILSQHDDERPFPDKYFEHLSESSGYERFSRKVAICVRVKRMVKEFIARSREKKAIAAGAAAGAENSQENEGAVAVAQSVSCETDEGKSPKRRRVVSDLSAAQMTSRLPPAMRKLFNIPVDTLKRISEKYSGNPGGMVFYSEFSLYPDSSSIDDGELSEALKVLFSHGRAKGNSCRESWCLHWKELLLMLASFRTAVGSEWDEWADFCFSLFDSDGGGDVSKEEVRENSPFFFAFHELGEDKESTGDADQLQDQSSESDDTDSVKQYDEIFHELSAMAENGKITKVQFCPWLKELYGIGVSSCNGDA